MAGRAGGDTAEVQRSRACTSCRREMVREVDRGEVQEGDAVRNYGHMRDRKSRHGWVRDLMIVHI